MDRIELQLIYEGDGRFRTASRLDLQLAQERYGQGEVIEVVPSKRRSRRQMGWLFAIIEQAFHNQSTGPEFTDPEHLRKWLLVRAGHANTQAFEPRAVTQPVVATLKQWCPHVFWSRDSQWIYARTARSMAMRGPHAIDSAAMTELADKMVEIIMAELVPGSARADWEPLLKEGERWAKRRDSRHQPEQ